MNYLQATLKCDELTYLVLIMYKLINYDSVLQLLVLNTLSEGRGKILLLKILCFIIIVNCIHN